MNRSRRATLERKGQGNLLDYAAVQATRAHGRNEAHRPTTGRHVHLPAAVIEDQAAPVARVVPPGAKRLKMDDPKAAQAFKNVKFGYMHKPTRISRNLFSMARQRLSEIENLIRYRHGGPCDTDDGALYFEAALPHIVAQTGEHRNLPHRASVVRWATTWTPGYQKELLTFDLDELGAAYATKKRLLRADTVAKMLRVTKLERDALGLTTIGAIDFKKGQRTKARKRRDRERKRAGRVQDGARPREQAATKTEPWIADGYNTRRTWERHGKRPRVANSSASFEVPETANVASSSAPIPIVLGADGSATPHVQGPARTARASRNLGAGGHSPRAKTMAGEASRPVALPLPTKAPDTSLQLDMFTDRPVSDGLAEALRSYSGGIVPPTLRAIVLDVQRRLGLRQEDVARKVRVSRPQLANAMSGRYGLSREPAIRLVQFAEAA